VPPTLANFASGLEHSIYNNVRQGQEHFYEQTVNPLWRQIAATYTKQLLRPDFEQDRSIRLRYDVTDVRALQEDMNEVYTRLSVAVEKGWVTKDEARAEVGLDPLPNGLGEAQDPIEQARQLTEATGGPPGQDEEEEEAPARRSLTDLETKQQNLAHVPELLSVLQQLTVPLVQQDLEAFFDGQRERVLAKAKGG
jgi:hypothetical protein